MPSPTQSAARYLAQALNAANPGEVANALAQLALGMVLSPLKVTFTGLTAAAAFDITAVPPSATAGFTVNQGAPNPAIDPGVPTTSLPPVLSATTLRVTAVGTGALGPRAVTDAGGTPGAPGATGPGIATLSDDGKTLTFEGTVTAFILEYIPRPAHDPSTTVFTPNTKA